MLEMENLGENWENSHIDLCKNIGVDVTIINWISLDSF